MAIDAMLGGFVGATALYTGLRTLAALARRRRATRRSDDFEQSLLEARAQASAPLAWRLATPTDMRDVIELDRVHPDDRALTTNGFHRLGEIIAVGNVRSVARAYADASATTIAVVVVANGKGLLDLRSFTTTGARFTTLRGARARLATAPEVRIVEHPLDSAVPYLVMQHAVLIKAVPALMRLDTIEALLAQVAANHDATRTWRDAQPPDELLDADLRALLRNQYDRIGAIWLQRLRSRIPAATLIATRG
ncbi:MAG TPA: hypothetical protein VGG28_04140 [Kofleriaceae bacterium]|jgi:hypothetical protein